VLDRHPLTLLGDVVRRRQFYDEERSLLNLAQYWASQHTN